VSHVWRRMTHGASLFLGVQAPVASRRTWMRPKPGSGEWAGCLPSDDVRGCDLISSTDPFCSTMCRPGWVPGPGSPSAEWSRPPTALPPYVWMFVLLYIHTTWNRTREPGSASDHRGWPSAGCHAWPGDHDRSVDRVLCLRLHAARSNRDRLARCRRRQPGLRSPLWTCAARMTRTSIGRG
jgi:hypothetical protein